MNKQIPSREQFKAAFTKGHVTLKILFATAYVLFFIIGLVPIFLIWLFRTYPYKVYSELRRQGDRLPQWFREKYRFYDQYEYLNNHNFMAGFNYSELVKQNNPASLLKLSTFVGKTFCAVFPRTGRAVPVDFEPWPFISVDAYREDYFNDILEVIQNNSEFLMKKTNFRMEYLPKIAYLIIWLNHYGHLGSDKYNHEFNTLCRLTRFYIDFATINTASNASDGVKPNFQSYGGC